MVRVSVHAVPWFFDFATAFVAQSFTSMKSLRLLFCVCFVKTINSGSGSSCKNQIWSRTGHVCFPKTYIFMISVVGPYVNRSKEPHSGSG